MVRRTIKNAKIIQRKTLQEAKEIFIHHCRIKNLTPRTLKYYNEDLDYFFSHIQVKHIDEITTEIYEAFLCAELDAGRLMCEFFLLAIIIPPDAELFSCIRGHFLRNCD